MLYQKPWMEILKIDERDVVITSLTGGNGNDFNAPGQGDDSTSTDGKWD